MNFHMFSTVRKKISLLIPLFLPLLCFGQGYYFARPAAGGGITPPTFIADAETAWDSDVSPKNGGSLSVQVGDVLVNAAVKESETGTMGTPVNSGTALTWTQQKTITTALFCTVIVWTTVATAAETITVTNTRTASPAVWGATTLQFRGASVGASQTNTTAAAQPAVALTTTQENSAVVVVNGDWDTEDGTTRTWRTVNSVTPTAGNGLEKTYFRDAAHYTVYVSVYDNVGAVGANTYGLTAPAGQKSSICALEIKGQ